MPYNPKIHRRRSIRLQNYDYSQPGTYFLTICVQDRACLFGDVVDGEMRLNDAGTMVTRWYNELAQKFGDVGCDAWVCMPNHVHCIVMNTGSVRPDDDPVGAACVSALLHVGQNWANTQVRPYVVWCNGLKPCQQMNIFVASVTMDGNRFPVDYGNAIIGNTSSAMKRN
jgi:hypothetical protein